MAANKEQMSRALMGTRAPMRLADLVAANQQRNPLVGLMSPVPGVAPTMAPQAAAQPYDNTDYAEAAAPAYTIFQPGQARYADAAPKDFHQSEDNGHYENEELRGGPYHYDMHLVKDGDLLHGVVSGLMKENAKGQRVPIDNKARFDKVREAILKDVGQNLPYHAKDATEWARWDSLTPAQRKSEERAAEHQKQAEDKDRHAQINSAVDAAVASGWRPSDQWPKSFMEFASPKSVARVRDRIAYHAQSPLRQQIVAAMGKSQ